ncbi:MAG: nucleoside kinase [Lachnospiraceae bacterium]|nr:nucleoside kinase [Lachnospiraceae bacterium]
MITVTIAGEEKQYEEGTTYEKIAEEYQKRYDDTIALVIADGKIRELMKKAEGDCELQFITLKNSAGHKAYVRTAIMMLIKALYDVEPRENIEKIKVEFAIGQGYYCSLKGNVKVDDTLVERLNVRMQQLVMENIPVEKKNYPIEEAIALFERYGMEDKKKLFKYRRSSTVNVYRMGDYYDYFYGYMLPSTGYVKYFNVISYESGLMLMLPDRKEPKTLDYFEPREKLFRALQQSTVWGEMMEIDTVGDLNDRICEGNFGDLVLVQEALQERRIAEIAEDIVGRRGVKFVMIAGPSSSGKTTFSHRLSIQLRSYGMKPHPIAVDDYFVDRELTPRDQKGNYDFECLEAIDIAKFNEDMSALLAGDVVELPSFNFKTGKREYKGNFKKLGRDDILVIEGIHGLNDKMSFSLPSESKYKIYISALTSLNVDEHNRIPTTDGRLIRRMVRDARTRGMSAKQTIAMWQSVRRGEEQNIFPFQESADATFNSVLIYELAVLKQFAEPLLFSIREGEPEYYEAKRLLKFLEYFLGVSSEDLPKNSIVREFVGGSVFHV